MLPDMGLNEWFESAYTPFQLNQSNSEIRTQNRYISDSCISILAFIDFDAYNFICIGVKLIVSAVFVVVIAIRIVGLP